MLVRVRLPLKAGARKLSGFRFSACQDWLRRSNTMSAPCCCLIQDMGTICILCIRYGAEVWHGTEGAEDTKHRP